MEPKDTHVDGLRVNIVYGVRVVPTTKCHVDSTWEMKRNCRIRHDLLLPWHYWGARRNCFAYEKQDPDV